YFNCTLAFVCRIKFYNKGQFVAFFYRSRYLKIGFTGNFNFSFLPDKNNRETNGRCCIEPYFRTVCKGYLVLATAWSGNCIVEGFIVFSYLFSIYGIG